MENIARIFPNVYALALGLFVGTFLVIRLVFSAFEKAAPKMPARSMTDEETGQKRYRKGLTVLSLFISAPIAFRVMPVESAVLAAVNRIFSLPNENTAGITGMEYSKIFRQHFFLS